MRTLWQKLRSLFSRSGSSVQNADPARHRSLGELGEDEAVRFLKSLGYRILARQMRNSFGEIDIIAEDGKVIVFVEVKTRSDESGGKPWEAVNQKRQERMTRAALAWLKKTRRLDRSARFDVISILWPDVSQPANITHFPRAFDAQGRGQMFR